jgi:O-antigen ligase
MPASPGMAVTDLLAILLGLGFALLTIAACLRWDVMAVAVLLSAITTIYFGFDIGVKLEILTLYPIDGCALIAATAAVLRLSAGGARDRLLFWWLATLAAWSFALLIGFSSYGVVTALIFFRKFFYLAALVLYMMSFRFGPADIRKLSAMWLVAACAIMVFCLLAKIDPSLVTTDLQPHLRQLQFSAERVVPSDAALVMVEAALIGLGASAGLRSLGLSHMLTVGLIGTVLLQYHRSTWLALFIGGLVMLRADIRRAATLAPVAILVCAALGIFWLVSIAVGQDFVTDSMVQAFSEPLDEERSSTIWRLEGWRILVGNAISEGPLRILFGGGFGVGFERRIGWANIEYSPHNLYVEIFLNAGLLGLIPFLIFFTLLLRRYISMRAATQGGVDHAVAASLLACILVYGLSYSVNFDQALMIGGLAAALQSSVASQPVAAVPRDA